MQSTLKSFGMIPVVTSCNTCKAAFPSTEKIREHYRGEWHSFNSKRRASTLPPLSLKEYASINAVNHSKQISAGSDKKKHSEPSLKLASVTIGVARENEAEDGLPSVDLVQDPTSAEILKDPAVLTRIAESVNGIATEGDDGDDVWTDEDDEDAAASRPVVEPHMSIFDNKVFEGDQGMFKCKQYMELRYGFFVPDIECVTDLAGLMTYLGEKVKHGGICLFCQKQFGPGQPCQNHMINKSHCKLAYLEGIDLHEYEDFYDYGLNDSHSENDSDLDDVHLSSIGELILPDKTLGNRAYLRYYKQHFKVPDTRPAVIAQKREEVIRMGLRFGGGEVNEHQLLKISDAEIAAVLARQRKSAMKEMNMYQRAEKKYEYRNKRSEYQSSVDKLRSKATTTEKIRDWHRKL